MNTKTYSEPIRCVVDGQEWQTYIIEYMYEGKPYTVHFKATSWDDAKRRRDAMVFGVVIGQLQGTMPAVPGGNFLADLVVWWKNRYGRS